MRSRVGTKVATRRFSAKAKKHEQIRVLAENKLNSITSVVSQALDDRKISLEEFHLVVKEGEKYQK